MAVAPPAPDQGQAAPPDAGSQDSGGSGQDQFTQLVSNLADGLTMLTQLAQQIDPASAQGFDQLNKQFQDQVSQLSQKLGQGGGGQAPAPAGQGMSSPEAGGAAGAKPAGPSY